MGTHISSISLKEKHYRWLEEKKNLGAKVSLSSITQNAIDELIEQEQIGIIASNKELRRRIEALAKHNEHSRDFIERKGLTDEYIKENFEEK